MKGSNAARTGRFDTRVICGFVAALSLVVGALAATQPAAATFPGTNGKIAFVRSVLGSGVGIWAMNADGTGETRLTTGATAHDFNPSWRPDGAKIAFVRQKGPTADVYVMNADGSGATRLAQGVSGIGIGAPAWSPDCSKIAFTRNGGPDNQSEHVWVMNADGTDEVQLTTDPAGASAQPLDRNPDWSPDGSKIAFTSTRHVTDARLLTNSLLYTMNADGTSIARLTNLVDPNHLLHERAPSWSPDGTKIVVRSDTDFGEAGAAGPIVIVSADGSTRTPLVRNPGGALSGSDPVWSPDGARIAFSDGTGGGPIHAISPDGTVEAALSDGPVDSEPDWVASNGTCAPGTGNTPPGDAPAECEGLNWLSAPQCSGFIIRPIDGVAVIFDNVTQGGNTTGTTSPTGPAPPPGFGPGTPATFYDVTTTATFSGAIGVCIDYTGTTFADEAELRLFHQENGVWVDSTESLDTVNDIICGRVSSLSPFGIFVAVDNVAPTTSASLSLAANANGWHRGDVTVTLNATDNPGGSGVEQIRYTIGGTMTTVTGASAMIAVTAEGSTTISYLAIDAAGNAEVARTLIVRIDKTAPEAVLRSDDAVSGQIVVLGRDALSGPVAGTAAFSVLATRDNRETRRYVVRDLADNVTLLDVRVTREDDDAEVTARVERITYDSVLRAGAVVPVRNKLEIEREGRKVEQQAELGQGRDTLRVQAEFDGVTTQIKTRQGDTSTRTTLPGLVLLRLVTSAGVLTIEP